jgi:membrane-associated protein
VPVLPFDLETLIKTAGYTLGHLIIFAIVFAESGLLVGFFLPGDSLLFTAGFLASQGHLNIVLLVVGCVIAAVAGDQVGYATGRRFGRRLFEREDSRFFHKQNLRRAEAFYEKHGGKALILARFVPVVRTFTPIVAGISAMEYRRFVTYNVVGGVLWAVGIPIGGYILGSLIPSVDRYLLPIIGAIVLISVLPGAWHLLMEQRHRPDTRGGASAPGGEAFESRDPQQRGEREQRDERDPDAQLVR